MRAEIRGRGYRWRVYYDDERGLATPFPVYDRDGVLTGVVMCGAPTDKGEMTECHVEFDSLREAKEYASYLGAEEVSVKKTLSKNEALARARAARKEMA